MYKFLAVAKKMTKNFRGYLLSHSVRVDLTTDNENERVTQWRIVSV